MRSPDPIPAAIAYPAYGGLLPFVALAIAHHSLPTTLWPWQQALIGYGAVILSFVGALHWAFAVARLPVGDAPFRATAGWSVVPALLAWVALMLPPTVACALLMVGFAAHLWQEHRLAARVDLPSWYLPMRLRLTVVVCICLATSWAA